MLVPLPVLMIICFTTVIIITTLTLLALKWGYAHTHTVDALHDKRGEQP